MNISVVIFLVAVVLLGIRGCLNAFNRPINKEWVLAYAMSYDDGIGNLPGSVCLHHHERSGRKTTYFTDNGFDGVLDHVRVDILGRGGKNERFDPNSPDWDEWVEKYHKVRQLATSGTPDPNS